MLAAYRKWRSAVDKCLQVGKHYCVVVMLVMLVIAFVQVIRRYVFNAPWVWSDEIILCLLGWFSYPALVFNVWTDDHFNISSVYDKFPVWLQIVCDVFRHILIGVFCALLGYFAWQMTLQYWPKPMPASGFSQGLKFIPVVIGGVLSAFFCISNLIGTFIDRPQQISPEEQERREKEFAERSIEEMKKLDAELQADLKKRGGK